MFVAFVRVLKFSVQDFLRNWWLSFITITIIFVTLFSVNIVLIWTVVTGRVLMTLRDRVDVTLSMKPTVKEAQVAELRDTVRGFSETQDVQYISRDEALARFREVHADNPVILESLDAVRENPLGASLVVKAKTTEGYRSLIEKITTSPYTSLILDTSFGDHAVVIDRITAVTKAAKKVGMITSILFASIAILIIFNTIRITIYTHRDEIGIMKRVGATNWFTATPFLMEGMLYGVIGFVFATALFFPFLQFIQPSFSLFFADYAFHLRDYFLQNAMMIFGGEFLSVLFVCFLSSTVATRRYLRV